MRTINISPDEPGVFDNFREGHPVQVRVSIKPGEENDYAKGTEVRVVCESEDGVGKIVSEPLEVDSKTEDGTKTLSLVVEKP